MVERIRRWIMSRGIWHFGFAAQEDESDVCRCGHDRQTHFRDSLACMASTAEETWACPCSEFVGRDSAK